MTTFFFACGRDVRRRDLRVALAVGQRDFLVPAGSVAAAILLARTDVRVVLDSGAWPPHNPARIGLRAYYELLGRLRRGPDDYGSLAWAASYDVIGDGAATARHTAQLRAWMRADGLDDMPIVPVVHYPSPHAVTEILYDNAIGAAGRRGDVPQLVGASLRPGYAVGGLVAPTQPTRPRVDLEAAFHWWRHLLDELARAEDDRGVVPVGGGLHLFGVARARFTGASDLVVSFDSSTPARMASFGWKQNSPRYTSDYGLSEAKLIRSREARLAWWICHVSASVGLRVTPIANDAWLLDDARAMQTKLDL